MEIQPDMESTTAFATGLYQGVQIVAYMKDRSEMIESVISKPETEHRDRALRDLWRRSRAWMQSLELLNHVKHFQAISSANRALLEITVDIILLHMTSRIHGLETVSADRKFISIRRIGHPKSI